MAEALLYWLLTLLFPVIGTRWALQKFPSRSKTPSYRNALLIHGTLLFCVGAGQYALHQQGYAFPWQPSLPSLVTYLAAAGFAVWLLGPLGLLYSLSSFLQQVLFLSTSIPLKETLPMAMVLLLVVPVFVIAHPPSPGKTDLRRPALFTVWGTLSVLLLSYNPDIWLLASLHTVLGATLIRQGILFPLR